jgi:hypothetical protein
MSQRRNPPLLFQSPPRQAPRVRLWEVMPISAPVISTTGETRRSWLICWLTSCLARVRGRTGSTGRSTSPSPTDTAALHSFILARGQPLFLTLASTMTPTHITSAPTLPPGYALSEAQALLEQLQGGPSAGGED